MHASSSARKLIMALRSSGGDTKGLMADELTDKIFVGVINLAIKKLETTEEKSAELLQHFIEISKIRNTNDSAEDFDLCVNLLAQAFKSGNCRNDYQFFWNMTKEAMYCVEADFEESCGVKLEASTISYHISNAAKESVGATGLKYASDQLVF